MRQACNHPALITGDSVDDADALDPTPERQSASISSASTFATQADDDDLLAALGGMSLSSSSSTTPAGPTCLLCAKPPSYKGTYCTTCSAEMEKYAGLTKSTKIQHVLRLLEEIRRESDVKAEREERRLKEEDADSDAEDLGVKREGTVKWKPKKTIIFSQVRLLPFRSRREDAHPHFAVHRHV
jgi:hypothetical protein